MGNASLRPRPMPRCPGCQSRSSPRFCGISTTNASTPGVRPTASRSWRVWKRCTAPPTRRRCLASAAGTSSMPSPGTSPRCPRGVIPPGRGPWRRRRWRWPARIPRIAQRHSIRWQRRSPATATSPAPSPGSRRRSVSLRSRILWAIWRSTSRPTARASPGRCRDRRRLPFLGGARAISSPSGAAQLGLRPRRFCAITGLPTPSIQGIPS